MALILAFVGIVKTRQIPAIQSGNETNDESRGNFTESNDPMETKEINEGVNDSLKVELLLGYGQFHLHESPYNTKLKPNEKPKLNHEPNKPRQQ